MLASRLGAAARAVVCPAGVRAASSSAAAAPLFPHSELTYRALLRNLRLLAGMRGDKKRFKALITGPAAGEIARHLRDNEPVLDLEVAGDSRTADWGAIAARKGAALDSVIVTQMYHTLRGPRDLHVIRESLHNEEGTAGFLWHRVHTTVRGGTHARTPPPPG